MIGNSRHLLGLDGLSAEDLNRLLDTAAGMKEISRRKIKKVPTLRGKTVVNLFFEPSTRTRTAPSSIICAVAAAYGAAPATFAHAALETDEPSFNESFARTERLTSVR